MKLYLFGGAETDLGQAPRLKELISDVLREIQPKQLLHIPHSRLVVPKDEKDIWGDGWVERDLYLDGIELLDARDEGDLAKAKRPVVFIDGGPQRDLLFEKIMANTRLKSLVMDADFIIGESAGSAICAQYRRTYKNGEAVVEKGLGILKDTMIKAHYTDRNRHGDLRDEMKMGKVKYGIGIDSLNAIVIDTETYPETFETIGDGLVEFLKLEELA